MEEHRGTKVILAILLWLLAAGLGLIAVYYIQELSVLGYATYLSRTHSPVGMNQNSTGVLIGQTVMLVGGIAWLATVIGLGEYQLKHAGERKAWKVFGWILGIELALILAGLLLP